jgi:N-acyl amino acid synthase of PEP-CTERM/exosortase system
LRARTCIRCDWQVLLLLIRAQMNPSRSDSSLYDYYHNVFEPLIANTEELRRECFKLRYQVYCVEKDWERGDSQTMATGLERDAYDDHAVHALLRHRRTGLFIGTVRLILHPEGAATGMLPIHALCAENNLQIPQLVPLKNMGEISRFCISKEFRRRAEDTIQGSIYTAEELAADRARIIPAMSLGLISMIYLMARQNGVLQWCAEMEPFLVGLLAKLGIYSDPVGPLIEFHGKRQICHKILKDWADRAKEERPEIWDVITDKGRYDNVGSVDRI